MISTGSLEVVMWIPLFAGTERAKPSTNVAPGRSWQCKKQNRAPWRAVAALGAAAAVPANAAVAESGAMSARRSAAPAEADAANAHDEADRIAAAAREP